METETVLILVGAGIVALWLLLFALGLAAAVAIGGVTTAALLFAWAAQYGFIGVALYIIVWVVATPFMLLVCLVGGLILAIAAYRSAE